MVDSVNEIIERWDKEATPFSEARRIIAAFREMRAFIYNQPLGAPDGWRSKICKMLDAKD